MKLPKQTKRALCSLALVTGLLSSQQALAGEKPYLAELMLTGATYCPVGWLKAEGQLLNISSYQSLFALLGTTYGGDARTTFAVPDLRGRAPVHSGTAPGFMTYPTGQHYGAEEQTLTAPNLPSHNHMVNATNAAADRHGPGTDLLATATYQDGTNLNIYSDGDANKQMNPDMIANTGQNMPFRIVGPRLAMTWCISYSGDFPPRP